MSQLELFGQKTCLFSFWLMPKKSRDPTRSIRVKPLKYVLNTLFCCGWIAQIIDVCSSKGQIKQFTISLSKPMALLRFMSHPLTLLKLMQLMNYVSVHYWLTELHSKTTLLLPILHITLLSAINQNSFIALFKLPILHCIISINF